MDSDVRNLNFIYFFCKAIWSLLWIPIVPSVKKCNLDQFQVNPVRHDLLMVNSNFPHDSSSLKWHPSSWDILGCVDGVWVGQGEASIVGWYGHYWIYCTLLYITASSLLFLLHFGIPLDAWYPICWEYSLTLTTLTMRPCRSSSFSITSDHLPWSNI